MNVPCHQSVHFVTAELNEFIPSVFGNANIYEENRVNGVCIICRIVAYERSLSELIPLTILFSSNYVKRLLEESSTSDDTVHLIKVS